MSDDFGNLTAAIDKAGKTKRVKEFEWSFLPGFLVKLVYVSKFHITQMRESARTFEVNPRNNQKEEKFEEKKVWAFYADRIIKGWTGFTVKHLVTLIPNLVIETVADLKKFFPGQPISADIDVSSFQIGHNRAITLSLFANSVEFENWVVNTASDLRNYIEVALEKEAQLENLK